MTMAPKLRQYMDDQGVRYDLDEHARTSTALQSAHAAHISGRQIAKAVIVHHEGGYVMAVCPGSHRILLGTLQDVVGKRLGLATEGEIASLFDDCVAGAIPPIGGAYGVPAVVDESCDGCTDLYFEGGDHCTLVHVSGEAFQALTRDAQRAQISQPV
jgi:Ala-tRNA(Pro) deacylase